MSTMPPAPIAAPARTPVAQTAPGTRATAAEDAAASGTVRDVFAALVDALTAQLDGADAGTVEGEPGIAGEEDPTAEAVEDVLPSPTAIAPVVDLPAGTVSTVGTADGVPVPTRPMPAAVGVAEVLGAPPAVLVPAEQDVAPVTGSVHGSDPTRTGDVAPGLTRADAGQPGPPLEAPVEDRAETVGRGEPVPAGPVSEPLMADAPLTDQHSTVRAGDRTAANPDASSAVAPLVSASPTAAPASDVGSAAGARPSAPALPEQLVEVLAPVRRGPDGDHRMSIQLRPEELGEVRIDVRVRGGEISLNLRADLPATSELLRDSLRELRVALEAAGFRSGELDVGSHARGGGATPDGSAHRAGASGPSTPSNGAGGDAPRAHPTAAATPTTGLDLRL